MNKLLEKLIPVLLTLIPDNIVKSALTNFFNDLEKQIKASKTEYDDIIVLPILNLIRKSLNV